MDETPLTPRDFAMLLAPFIGGEQRVAVAVSGGPDSMALAWGAAQALGAARIKAFIVDHALRACSAEEAAQTKQRLTSMGIGSEILRWEHGAITSRIHVEARRARYGLLIEACKKQGLDRLLLAHHADDQAETILMRLAKGSGPEGLAGMAGESLQDGIRLVRPLLGISKARLLATCATHVIPFATDPSNASDKYARGRLRRVMPLLEAEGFTQERLLDLGVRSGEAAQAMEHYARDFLRNHAEQEMSGLIRFAFLPLHELPRAVALKALALCLMSVHRGDYPPEREKLISLLDWLGQGEEAGRSLYGCLIQKGAKEVHILREPSAATEVQKITPGQLVLWDGRWRVQVGPQAEEGCTLRALGLQPHDLLDQLAPGLRQKIPQGRVRACLPSFWRGETLVSLPLILHKNQEDKGALCLPPLWV